MGPGPPPGAASRSSTPTVRSIRQPVPPSLAKLGMAALPPASAARAAPVADIMARKHIKPCLDMFHPWQQTGFAAHRLSPDLPLLQQVEQSPRAEEYFDLDVFANMSEFATKRTASRHLKPSLLN